MFRESENLKDIRKDSVKDMFSISVPYRRLDPLSNAYPKLNKLITALYIVTDIIDKEEPIRLKLRTLGVEILSDINSVSRSELNQKVNLVLSFLDIALAINLISEMNSNILKKEFVELNQSFQSSKESDLIDPLWLKEFLLQPSQTIRENKNFGMTSSLKNRNESAPNAMHGATGGNASYILKKQRQNDIIKAIKDNDGNATIADIRNKASDLGVQPNSLTACSEKTLQRELVSMVKGHILNKTGEKRWSRYQLIDQLIDNI